MTESKCEALNVAREAFLKLRPEHEWTRRYHQWMGVACATFANITVPQPWETVREEVAAELANAIMQAVADIEEAPVSIVMMPNSPAVLEPQVDDGDQVALSPVSASRKRPPAELTERIARSRARIDKALARATTALEKDGMEIPV